MKTQLQFVKYPEVGTTISICKDSYLVIRDANKYQLLQYSYKSDSYVCLETKPTLSELMERYIALFAKTEYVTEITTFEVGDEFSENDYRYYRILSVGARYVLLSYAISEYGGLPDISTYFLSPRLSWDDVSDTIQRNITGNKLGIIKFK